MSTQSSGHAARRPWQGQLQQRVYSVTMRRIGSHLRRAHAVSKVEKDLTITGLVLGGCSILTAVFPICSLPMGIAGLWIGLHGRRHPALYTLATWGAALSVIGLALTIMCTIIGLGVYFGHAMWG
ncbi:MAG TPA: hypothetical protein VL485_17520 [Ktedonobacteraceae bacterium]|jgi:hypothetical protein|nr:hypothetical protein [Ktedonobacteraceae bacterium]